MVKIEWDIKLGFKDVLSYDYGYSSTAVNQPMVNIHNQLYHQVSGEILASNTFTAKTMYVGKNE